MAVTETPSIAVTLCLTPSSFPKDIEPLPELSISATLHATQPITIFTWPSIFNPSVALVRHNFFAEDLTTGEPVRMDTSKIKRRAYMHQRGDFDEKYHFTLHPGSTTVVSHHFHPMRFKPGHQYRLGVTEGEALPDWLWWWGTFDDVLSPEEGPPKDIKHLEGRFPLELKAEPIVFTVEENRNYGEHSPQ
ncbi:uncharacterized protein K452DRAFT_298283 [Aplosporella prunicola CBS 121167]|uniref:Uncharacterized protein n=1 Tax=Aplosporella prunicola CBS 121167 TaxID=1176127 RepID=A0A6A6BC09_9PEZI|nr:uncharacterized protein K452DRAFT_298283 [Aplosporella prunicola CBS 121167]KAF2141576.1 hypothetical protein K452DRAFT_298283 [Aplosporella prunicola CBS 121167]